MISCLTFSRHSSPGTMDNVISRFGSSATKSLMRSSHELTEVVLSTSNAGKIVALSLEHVIQFDRTLRHFVELSRQDFDHPPHGTERFTAERSRTVIPGDPYVQAHVRNHSQDVVLDLGMERRLDFRGGCRWGWGFTGFSSSHPGMLTTLLTSPSPVELT